MYGAPAMIDKCREFGVRIIEDCAHSIGSKYKGRKVGSWGDLSLFSFEGTKYIVTGEGGMVLANDPILLDKLRKTQRTGFARLYGKIYLSDDRYSSGHWAGTAKEIRKFYKQTSKNCIEL